MFELLLVLHYVLFSVFVLANKFDLISFDTLQQCDIVNWDMLANYLLVELFTVRTFGVCGLLAYDRCTDWLKFYLDLERPEVNERSVWNYELCGSLSTISRRHYSSSSNLVLELHSDSAQTNHSGFRGVFKFIPRCTYTVSTIWT